MSVYQMRTGSWQTLIKPAAEVRYQVFVQEQNVPLNIEMDALDNECEHVVIYDQQGRPIATARLLPNDHIGRMAVLAEHRGQGVGALLLKTLIEMALIRGSKTVFLSAQLHALPFYTKYGFNAYGEIYEDAGMAHRMMRNELSN